MGKTLKITCYLNPKSLSSVVVVYSYYSSLLGPFNSLEYHIIPTCSISWCIHYLYSVDRVQFLVLLEDLERSKVVSK